MAYTDSHHQLSAADASLPFARSYQLEALEQALKQNTIVFLETGSGKTLIAIMLLRSYAHLLRKQPSSPPFYAVFLVPQVVLVSQQAEALRMHTDLKVGIYWGEMGVDFWDAATWKKELDKNEVLVMTPQILLNGLRHSFFKIDSIKVLILDECHHATGKHPYACIMTEFYHRQLSSGNCNLPRIFGMTASPIKSKGTSLESTCWQTIRDLETIMYSKVYTCTSESVLAEFVPFSTPKFRFYKHMDIPYHIYACLVENLKILKAKHEDSLNHLDLNDSAAEAARKKVSKIFSTLIYCLDELGVWLALKAAQFLSCYESDLLSFGKLDTFGEKTVKDFSLAASHAFATCITNGPEWFVGGNAKNDVDAGLLTTKIVCLIESLLEYRNLKEIRCIIFVQRVITAIVLQSLLAEFLPKYNSWKTKYVAGNNSQLQSQTRKTQNEIVEEFQKGKVNIIVATSILEEGLDVQSCNLVIRFDPSNTVSSFIQSRGRARMQNSEYLLMVKSGDISTHSRLEKYLASGEIMRKESLRHAEVSCSSLESELNDDEFYHVESTGAIVTLGSSVHLIYLYCSRLPSDVYFKPTPRCIIEKETGTCTLLLPKSCPIQSTRVQGHIKIVKQKACLEACKQLHTIGALTDHLVPDIFVEEAIAKEVGNEPYNDEQPIYFPPELVNQSPQKLTTKYCCYLIKLDQCFQHDVTVQDVMLVLRTELESDISSANFDLEVDRGLLKVNLRYVGEINLTHELMLLCRRFNVTLLKILLYHNLNELDKVLKGLQLGIEPEVDYFLLPAIISSRQPSIDWTSVASVLFSYKNVRGDHKNCPLKDNARFIQTKNGLVCKCKLQNSLVYTPHNGKVYCVNGAFDDLNGNSLLSLRDRSQITYKKYYEVRHGIKLCFEKEVLLKGRHIFPVQNYLHRCRQQKEKESENAYVELPPELCCIIMSPISTSTFYSFTFIPSIMHRLESLLIAINLKKIHLDCFIQNIDIPTTKILEAITTKKCQERFHLESLETLGDSFLKYAASQQLFKTDQNYHEGILSIKKEKIISNAALCKLGCDHKLPGFIRNESFDPKRWIIPGDNSGSYSLKEELLSNTRKVYARGIRKVKNKTVADVVEALIGAYLSSASEVGALLFMNWIGIKVDFVDIPYQRDFKLQPHTLVNVRHLESVLNYSFRDPSLLVEALTHGSYMLPEIPRCYQRLEFLGDSVLDYLVTMHLYLKYPEMSPGLLTDMRSASVNNDCYAQSAIKGGLYKHILHASQKLHKDIADVIKNFEKISSESTFGWESEVSLPKVLGDVVESLAGAILVDSGYNKKAVFRSIRPLLEPMITPETVRFHPVRELNEVCQKQNFERKNSIFARENGTTSCTIEVEANGEIFRHTASAKDKKMAKKNAAGAVLKALKESIHYTVVTTSKASSSSSSEANS